MAVARLNLLCHPATAATRAAAFPADEPPEPAGLRRLGAVSRNLPACDAWLTSPAPAARDAAALLCPAGAAMERGLRDCDYGRWAGRSVAAVQAEAPDAFASWLTDPAAAPHGGESLVALFARVSAWLAERQARGGTVLAVTHPAVVRAAVALALEAGVQSFWRIDAAPLCLARLSGHGGRWTLVSVGPVGTYGERGEA